MTSQNPTLKSLFEGEKVYRVPLYQRLYVWNEADQWGPLWEDIISIATDVAAGERVTPHFFGALVLKRSDGVTPDESSVWRVIDGQQRLTTMQLVMAAVADELSRRGQTPRLVAQLKELIENPEHAWPSGRRYKMRHGGNNYNRFTDVMSADGDEDVIAAFGGAMAQCYLYFRRNARSWLSDHAAENGADALTDTLRRQLQTVAIYLDPEEPEHLIFETLNARGASLTEWDKIRNYLFYRIEDDQDGFFRKHLERFDEEWWRAVSGRGQDARPRTDRFVDYWLESRLHRPVSRSRVFREFKDDVKSRSDERLITDIESLKSDAEYYRRFESGSDGGDDFEVLFHERRRWMDLGSFWPFLLGLRRANLDRTAFHVVLSTLESWFVRRSIWRHQARGYPDRALELLRRVSSQTDSADVPGDIIDRLAEIDEPSGRWPTDDQVKEAVAEWWLPSHLRRLLLEAVERHITPETAEKGVPKQGDLQIEHVMPVAWKRNKWPMGDESAEAREERDNRIQTLGNLTLVHEKVNPRIGNAAWNVKRGAIEENSNLFLNRDLLKRAPEEWDEEAIRKRGKWLAGVVCEIWPYADALRERLPKG